METRATSPERPGQTRPAASTAGFDYAMLALAAVLVLTVAVAAAILIILPEALDAVSSPAFGAPWITATATVAAARRRDNPPGAGCGHTEGRAP